MKQLGKARALVAIGAIALIAAACSGGGGATTAPSSRPRREHAAARARRGRRPSRRARPAGSWKIGYSNGGGVGNGFREEQVCTAKAEALASAARSPTT